jgi:hypothetical protein
MRVGLENDDNYRHWGAVKIQLQASRQLVYIRKAVLGPPGRLDKFVMAVGGSMFVDRSGVERALCALALFTLAKRRKLNISIPLAEPRAVLPLGRSRETYGAPSNGYEIL